MLVGRKYRLYPNAEQAHKMREYFGAVRAIHNLAVEQRQMAYRLTGQSPGYSRQCADLKTLRDDPGAVPWLRHTPMQVLQQSLRDVNTAYDRFFRGISAYPRYHAKYSNDAFRMPQHVAVRKTNRKWSEVQLQSLGWVRFRRHRALDGEISNATVKHKAGQWTVSFQAEVADVKAAPNRKAAVDVDRGVAHNVATSTGEFLDAPTGGSGAAQRLLRLERRKTRQQKGLQELRANLHEHRAVARSRGGTLNKAILESSWGQLNEFLKYKCEWYGSRLATTNAAYSSQECSERGHTCKENRESQAVFRCQKRGHAEHSDVNAAKVILKRVIASLEHEALLVSAAGQAVVARGELEVLSSAKREPGARALHSGS